MLEGLILGFIFVPFVIILVIILGSCLCSRITTSFLKKQTKKEREVRATAISVGHWFHTAAWAFSSGLTWGRRKVS